MTRRKSKLKLNPKKRTHERVKRKSSTFKSATNKHMLDIDQILNETVKKTTFWTKKRHQISKSVPRRRAPVLVKSPYKRTYSEKKRSRVYDSGGRSPFPKKFRLGKKTPLKSPRARHCNVTQRVRIAIATKLFEENGTKINDGNESLTGESIINDHCYSTVSYKITKDKNFPDNDNYSDLGVSEIQDSDNEEESLKTLTELAPVVLSELKKDKNFPDNDNYSDLGVSEIQDSDDEEESLKTLTELAPVVLSELKKYELQEPFVHFFQEVADGKFPLTNISFLLWLDVVNWYKHEVTSSMRYMEQTKKFWKLGWRHFGGKFVRFMTGFKNTSDVLSGESEKGSCKPENSDINFVIPSLDVLRNYTPYGTDTKPRDPGIYTDVMESVSSALEGTSACLTFDGKKLKQGLTENYGDVDILGFEDGPSLSQRKTNVNNEIEYLSSQIGVLKLEDGSIEIGNLSSETKALMKHTLLHSLVYLSENAQNVRKIRKQKEYAKNKFLDQGGKDWRQSKFVYVISAMNAFLYEIENFLSKYLEVLDKICQYIAVLNQSDKLYQTGQFVNLSSQPNCVELSENEETDDTRFIKQRTEKWHSVRKEASVTGSTIYQSLGLDTLKKQREHFDKVVCGIAEQPKPEEVQKAMQYGTENEINAIATMVGKVLPVIAPEQIYVEEGCIKIEYQNQTFMVVSPDGSLRSSQTNETIGAVEFKCPTKISHTEVPKRYYLQCLSTMEALDVETLYYVCWRPDVSTVFKVNRNKDLFERAMALAVALYGVEKPKRPVKVPDEAKAIQTDIDHGIASVEYLGEFPSAYASTFQSQLSENHICNTDLIALLEKVQTLTKESYELQREKASEAMVFLVSDLDRNWSKNPLRWAPVCWFPKGYSLTTETLRNLLEHVQTLCKEAGLHIPAISFDGQWHNVAVRGIDNQPMTLLQLQKDVWRETEKMQKSTIVQKFTQLNKTPRWYKQVGGPIICLPSSVKLPKTPPNGWIKTTSNEKKQTEESVPEEIKITEVIPMSYVQGVNQNCEDGAFNLTLDDVMEYITIDQQAAKELDSCNFDTLLSEDSNELVAEPDLEVQVDPHPCGLSENFMDTDGFGEAMSDLFDVDLQSIPVSNESTNQSDVDRERADPSVYSFSKQDAATLLVMLQTDKNANQKGIWDNRDASFILSRCTGVHEMKSLRDVDLKVLVRYMHNKTHVKLLESQAKHIKLAKFSEVFGLPVPETSITIKPKKRKKPIQRLSEKAASVMQSKQVPKQVLNISYSEYIWPEKLEGWKRCSPLKNEIKIDDTDCPEYWFYIPEYSNVRKQLEVKCVDSTHLLTRSRRKTCKGGIEGISKDAWMKVAKSKKTLLSPIMVEDIVDPMSVSMANTHFSEAVEDNMRENGDFEAASLCQDIREWWFAEDSPGISAKKRVDMRMKLRRRLVNCVDHSNFPPPTMYVRGWPTQLWEALLASIDAKSILYALCKQGTYNTRAFSSMMGETFFSELTNEDRRGHGTVSVEDFAHFLGTSIEQMRTRLDSDR